MQNQQDLMPKLHAENIANTNNLENNSTNQQNNLMPKLHAENMASTNTQNNQQNNLEDNQQDNLEDKSENNQQNNSEDEDGTQPGPSHCFMAYPDDVEDTEEPKSETSQGTPTNHEELIKSDAFTVTDDNNEETRSRRELSDVSIAKTISWEKLSSEQAILENPQPI